MTSTTFPVHLWPVSAEIRQDQLHLGSHNLADLADRWGTPLYVYDAATFDAAISAYLRGLRAWPGETRLAYAAKAWLNLPFAQILKQRGLDLDIVSVGELGIAQAADFPPGRAHLHGNNKTAELLKAASDWGIGSIVVDNLHELSLLEALTAVDHHVPDLWLRLNPHLLAPTHPYRQTGHAGSKFGLSRDEALEAARRIRQNPHLRLTGLHTHIGSQIFAVEAMLQAIDELVALAVALRAEGGDSIRFLCPGGGLGAPYHPADPTFDLARAVERIAEHGASAWQSANGDAPHPTLVLEPGRSLIARAGVALYRVGAIRHLQNGLRIVAIDGGMADNPRPALYGARYTACLPRSPLSPPIGPARIVGPLCESGDFLIDSVELPELVPGDILAVPVAGAYQLSMASNFNATLRPPVYWLEDDQWRCFQRRQTVADLLRRDVALTESPRSGIKD
ncbi:MAG TPA: diaminopimelate decarboxylase [Caldilineae bacterium]|nr:diaminopimelate decarboxylase [Caldilineae bacterium]